MNELLSTLFSLPGAPSQEGTLAAAIEKAIRPYCDEVRTDALGNLLAFKHAKTAGGQAQKRLLSAPLDSCGFVVNFIEDNGFLRVTGLGAPEPLSAAYAKVAFSGGALGVLVPEKDGELPAFDKCYVDIGAKSRAEAQERIKLGETGEIAPAVTPLRGGRYAASGAKGRVCASILADVLRGVSDSPYDLCFAFTAQDELRHRGAQVAAFGSSFDAALSLGVVASGDMPGYDNKGEAKIGEGAVILARVGSFTSSPVLCEELSDKAKEKNIPFAVRVYGEGTCGASALAKAGEGCPCAALALPMRRPDSCAAVWDEKDAEALTALAKSFCK